MHVILSLSPKEESEDIHTRERWECFFFLASDPDLERVFFFHLLLLLFYLYKKEEEDEEEPCMESWGRTALESSSSSSSRSLSEYTLTHSVIERSVLYASQRMYVHLLQQQQQKKNFFSLWAIGSNSFFIMPMAIQQLRTVRINPNKT